MTPIAPLITSFLREHMPIEQGYSPHTCEHFERFIALLASHVTLVLVLAKCAVVKGLQTGQEDIDQVVVQPIVLIRDKGNEMQIPFPLDASGQLKDLGFDDAIGIVQRRPLKTCR
jgi:hypothetical protein